MSKSIKFDENVYLDSTSIVHNKKELSDLITLMQKDITSLSDKLNYSSEEIEIGTWNGSKAYRRIFIQRYNNTEVNFLQTGLSGIGIFNLYGTFIGANHTIPLNFYNSGTWTFCHANSTGSTFTYQNKFEAGAVHIIIEYIR